MSSPPTRGGKEQEEPLPNGLGSLEWREIHYNVNGGRKILQGMSGRARPGKLLGILGGAVQVDITLTPR